MFIFDAHISTVFTLNSHDHITHDVCWICVFIPRERGEETKERGQTHPAAGETGAETEERGGKQAAASAEREGK